MIRRFRDRRDAGIQLAGLLQSWAGNPDAIVLALPRGGVPVGWEVARHLGLPLDIIVARKVGVPWQPELALGAVAGEAVVLNQDVLRASGLSESELRAAIAREQAEAARRERRYRGERPPPDLHDRVVILVDDGLATGATMRAAVASVAQQEPASIIVAVPVAAPETRDALRQEVDDVVCVLCPEDFLAVGRWYLDFEPTEDEEVEAILREAWQETRA